MKDPRELFEIQATNGCRLKIDPFHDTGHVVLSVETKDPDDLKPGEGDISLSPGDLQIMMAWIRRHLAMECPTCGKPIAEPPLGN